MTTRIAHFRAQAYVAQRELCPSQVVDNSNELRNQAVGLGGNVVYVTLSTLGVPAEGVVYRCP
jgi:hypothetical protein